MNIRPKPFSFTELSLITIASLIVSMAFFVIYLLMLAVYPAHAHDSWISRGALKNQAGEWCCGDNDCQELNYTPHAVSGGIQLETGETIPQSEIMPLSPEGYVICRRHDGTRRCVFAPPSGS